MADYATIAAIAADVRAGMVADAPGRGKDPITLAGDCTEASCRLREALEAARIRAAVRCGRFRVDSPDPRICMCQGRIPGHHELCFLWSHAWVEVDGLIVDITASQFAGMLAAGSEAIVTRSLADAEAARWIPD